MSSVFAIANVSLTIPNLVPLCLKSGNCQIVGIDKVYGLAMAKTLYKVWKLPNCRD